MELEKAEKIAYTFIGEILPYCDRIEIAGSVRRRKDEVGDIEIVAIPKIEIIRILFGEMEERHIGFIHALRRYPIIKGSPETGKYIQLQLPEIKVDLFLATPLNWGYIFAIRTGSAEFSRFVLACGWVRAGYKGINGMLENIKTGEKVTIEEEIDLFNLIGIEYVKPENR